VGTAGGGVPVGPGRHKVRPYEGGREGDPAMDAGLGSGWRPIQDRLTAMSLRDREATRGLPYEKEMEAPGQ
jgi:hypothetical protein